MKSQDSIKAKLQKLLKLQEGALRVGNTHEAENAAAKIQKILLDYNLEMSEIGQEIPDNPMMHESEDCFRYRSIGGRWEICLLNYIAYWNFCKVFKTVWNEKTRKGMIFGRKENVTVVIWLWKMLSERFVEIGKIDWKTYSAQHESVKFDTFMRNFLMGCADGIWAKFQAEDDARKDAAMDDAKIKNFDEKVTSLVKSHLADIEQYREQNGFTSTTARKAPKGTLNDAHWQGYQFGKNTQIYRGVTDNGNATFSNAIG